ncbi:MAG: hypothetical protein ABI912_11050 [Actinomycetota bacterium]
MTWPPPPSDYYGSTPSGQWPTQQASWDYDPAGNLTARPDYGLRRDLALAVFIIAVLAIAGVFSGLLWHAVSARPHVIEGPGGAFQLPADTDKNYFGAEAAFLAVTGVAGLVSGLLAWFAGHRRGPAIPVALGIGSAAAGIIARVVGQAAVTNATLDKACGKDKGFDGICAVYNGHLHLRIAGLTLVWAILSITVFLSLSLMTGRAQRSQRRQQWPSPQEMSSWQPPPPSSAPFPAPPTPAAGSALPPEPWHTGYWPPP